MQNTIQKFRRSTIVSEKPDILSENLKTLTSSNYLTVQYFWLKLRTRFLLTNAYKRVCGIFFISFRSWVICKNLKRSGFYTLVFTLLLITQDLNKIKKNLRPPFVDITKSKMCANFQQKMLNFMLVGARQIS